MKKANPVGVGVFLFCSMVLGVLFILVFSTADFYEDKEEYVAFFPGSVKGLSVGSPVFIKGVPVGKVTEIKLLVSPERTDRVWIPVIFEINRKDMITIDGRMPEDSRKIMQSYIDDGIRAKLIAVSLVTGQLAVMLDHYPGEPALYQGVIKDLVEIPTTLSNVDKVEAFLENLNVEDFLNEALRTLSLINGILESREIATVLKSLASTLEESQKFGVKLNESVDPIVAAALNALAEFKALSKNLHQPAHDALEQAESTFKEYQSLVKDGEDMNYEVRTALSELVMTLQAVRQLAEHLERNPEALLRGNPN